ncbi:MAG TPA: DUF4124 domain-containing protein [Pseudomonadales bacterium]
MRVLTVLILVQVLLSASASANTIYRCKDASGRMIFQQVPCAEDQITGNALPQQLWRQMRGLAAEGEKILNNLGADVESIKQCQASMQSFQQKLDALRPQVGQVARGHPDLLKAHSALGNCATCRTSAIANCSLAKDYLDRAMVKLTEY